MMTDHSNLSTQIWEKEVSMKNLLHTILYGFTFCIGFVIGFLWTLSGIIVNAILGPKAE